MTSWRPKDWNNPWPAGEYLNELECLKMARAYEDGADAMYEALKGKKAKRDDKPTGR